MPTEQPAVEAEAEAEEETRVPAQKLALVEADNSP